MTKKTHLRNLLTAVALTFSVVDAQAATVSLVPVSGPVSQGEQETFSVVANFGAETIALGGSAISWDSTVLSFGNFTFGPALSGRMAPLDEIESTTPGSVSFGFGYGPGASLSMPSDTVIGTLTLNATGAPGASAFLNIGDGSSLNGWFGASNLLTPIAVTYTGTTGSILPITNVPLPTAVWLFGSALAAFTIIGRRGKV